MDSKELDEAKMAFKNKDYAKAAKLYQKACDDGNAVACTELGAIYVGGSIQQDYVKAASLYQKACEGGDATGCGNLASMYLKGVGGREQNYLMASELFEKVCNGGVATACNDIGAMYMKGVSVRQDYAKARDFFKKACDLHDQDGCSAYAELNKGGY